MSAKDYAYCPYYCEENIWQLCAHDRVADAERRVLFISNANRRVAMWGQRAAPDPRLPIAWDYHVVLLFRPGDHPSEWLVWDLDAANPEPRPAEAWLRESFDAVGLLPPIYAPRFRMVSCAEFRRHFRSDRRHMRLFDGSARQPPPPWPAIMGEPPPVAPDDGGSNLERFIDTIDHKFLGRVFDLPGFRRWLQSEGSARA